LLIWRLLDLTLIVKVNCFWHETKIKIERSLGNFSQLPLYCYRSDLFDGCWQSRANIVAWVSLRQDRTIRERIILNIQAKNIFADIFKSHILVLMLGKSYMVRASCAKMIYWRSILSWSVTCEMRHTIDTEHYANNYSQYTGDQRCPIFAIDLAHWLLAKHWTSGTIVNCSHVTDICLWIIDGIPFRAGRFRYGLTNYFVLQRTSFVRFFFSFFRARLSILFFFMSCINFEILYENAERKSHNF